MGLDPAKLLFILIIALIVLGPERLPRAARQAGAAWRELNKMREKFEDEVRSAVPDLDLPSIPRLPTSPSRAVTGYINDLLSGSGSTSANTFGVNDAVDDEDGGAEVGGLVTVDDSAHGHWPEHEQSEAQAPSMWRPYVGNRDADVTRRPATVPSMAVGGSLGADHVLVLDEPSMN